MKKEWITPRGEASNLCLSLLNQTHLLIAGSSGSGKSVLINSFIYNALYKPPNKCKFVLIDPKGTELYDYINLPHCLIYAHTTPEIVQSLNTCIDIMEQRNKECRRAGIKKSLEADIYIIVDEYADLMNTAKKAVIPLFCRIALLGRSANMHLILATQRPTRDIITGQIKVNLDSRVALHCPTPQDSRNIIDVKGAETLPRYGYGYYLTPEYGLQLVKIPFTDQEEIAVRIKWWIDQAPRRKKLWLERLKNL